MTRLQLNQPLSDSFVLSILAIVLGIAMCLAVAEVKAHRRDLVVEPLIASSAW